MNTHSILTTLKTEDYEANYYQYPGMQIYDVINFWPLKSGNILICKTEVKAEEKLHLISFLSLNPRKQTIQTLSEFTTPIAKQIAGKTFLQYLLPESAMLTEINDEIINLSEEEKFMYRAICLDVDVFIPNIPYTEMDLSDKRKMKISIDMYLSYIKFCSIKLTPDLFGVLKENWLDVYKQTYNQVINTWAIQKKYSEGSSILTTAGGNNRCYPIDSNTFVLSAVDGYYKVNFKMPKGIAEFNWKKLEMPEISGTPSRLDNSYFYVNKTEYSINDKEYFLKKLDLTTGLSAEISLELPSKYVPHISQNFVLDKPYFICNINYYDTAIWKRNSFIFDPSCATYQLAEVFTNCEDITMLSNYSFLASDAEKNSIAIIRFPRWDAWLTQINQTLNKALDKNLIPPLISIVEEYLNHDITVQRQQLFFNSKNDFIPTPPEEKNQPPQPYPKCCTIQ